MRLHTSIVLGFIRPFINVGHVTVGILAQKVQSNEKEGGDNVANWDNENTRQEEERIAATYDEGLVEGYEANVNVLPEFYFKPYYMLTARQRAYIFGREVRLNDMAKGIT